MTSDRKPVFEVRRTERLHAAFAVLWIKRVQGAQLKRELRKLARRFLKSRSEAYSMQSLYRLWYLWTKDPRPETLARKYKATARVPTSPAVLVEFIRRVSATPDLSCRRAYSSLVSDAGRGVALPGTNKTAAGPLQGGVAPSRLPSEITLRRALGKRFGQLRRPAVKGLRAIARFDAYLDERVGEIEAKH